MSGAGHVQDMNNRIRQNRAQRPSKRPKFREHNRETGYASEGQELHRMKFKTVAPDVLAKIKTQIRERAQRDTKKQKVVLVVLALLVALLLFLLIRGWF